MVGHCGYKQWYGDQYSLMFFEVEFNMFIVEAIVKGEMQHDRKLGDLETDITKLQLDTIEAIRDKATRGHLHQYDVGRRDTREERIHIDINVHDIHKEKRDVDVGQVDKHKEKVDIDITVKTQTKEKD